MLQISLQLKYALNVKMFMVKREQRLTLRIGKIKCIFINVFI